ncbi:MAG: sensor histidine kinase [Bryobacteraceae bacterium]
MHIRIWPILIIGFGALISLIGLSGWLAYARSKSTYAGISELYRSEHDLQASLTQIRSDIDRSAILLRDFLLDSRLSADRASTEMRQIRTSTDDHLRLLQRLMPSAQSGQLARLRTQASSYWSSLEPVFTKDAEKRSRLGFTLVQTEILPRRQAALRLVTEIQRLSNEAFQDRRQEIDRRNRDLSFYLANMAGITLLIALVVAGISVFRMHSLERTADVQHKQVQEAETDLRRLSQQLVRTQEEERRSLSRDLHDQVGQVLTALRISLGNLENTVQSNDEAVAKELDLAKRLAAQAMRSTRELAMDLRPAMLDDLGLEAALQWYARQHSKVCGVPVSVNVRAPLDDLSEAQKTCVYRIVQEALNNSAKYSRARNVNVVLDASPNSITLRISDDGCGFNLAGIAGKGLGLLGMRERIAELGGNLTIDSNPNEGTRISADLPLS